ncbi:MAG TPA: cation:proton antiporter [Longimicrobiales bacterium]|nr:cation:proton antiporter [Longimicrobiales bacterium]
MDLDLANLLFVLLAAWLAGGLTARLGYPAVLGELLIGILLGPPILGLLSGGPALAVLAEIGILLMMLYVGMEVDPRELGRASWGGFLAAIGGFITPFVLAFLVSRWFGVPTMGAVFVGIAAGVTSLTTKSRILLDLHLLDTRVAHVLMAGALVADTLSLVVFAAVLGVVDAGTLDLGSIARVGINVVAFFAITAVLGIKVFPAVGQRLTRAGLTDRTFHFTLVLLLAVFFGELAHLAGLHSVLGAFIAGLFIRENVLGPSLSKDLMGAVRDASVGFLAPIFFVTAGFEVSLSVFGADLALFAAILGVATIGKIVGTALFYLPTGQGWREGLTIGAGMNGRGAVEIIVAGIALEMGLISQEIFSILVFMAIFTTATVPFLLKWGTDWLNRRGELVRSAAERRGTLILGTSPTARRLARILGESRPVWMVDANPHQCRIAEREGLDAVCGNALEEQVLSEANAARADSIVAMTGNVEVNALGASIARTVFLVPEVLVLRQGKRGASQRTTKGQKATTEHLHAHVAFASVMDLTEWDYMISRNAVREFREPVENPTDAATFLNGLAEDRDMVLMAVQRGDDIFPVHGETELRPGDQVIGLARDGEAPPA